MSDFILAQSLLIGLIAIALVFDFLNGLHDAANSIATIVSTRVLPARYAVFWASASISLPSCSLGSTLPRRSVQVLSSLLLSMKESTFAALSGAIVWNVVTWLFGIPSSSSHALVGGLGLGAGVAKAGIGAVVWSGLSKTAAAIVLSPLAGFCPRCCWFWRYRGPSCGLRRLSSTAVFEGFSSCRLRSTR